MTRERGIALLLWAATLAVLAWHGRQLQFFCDDSYISYRYAQNFAEGRGLVYNSGERVEGYTNFLWVVLLAGGIRMGWAAEPVSLWLGVLFLLVTLAATALLARRLLRSAAFAAVPPLLLVCQGPMVLWAVCGLEATFFAAATLVALIAYERGYGSWKGQLLAGALYALSTMVRPDGVIFGGAAGLHLLAAGLMARPLDLKGLARRAAALAGGFLLLFAPFVLWRHHYYGDWLPNTFYVKAGGRANVTLGLDYLANWLREYPIAGALAVAGTAAALLLPRWRAQRRTFAHLALALLLFSGYLVWAGGDYMALYRFMVPLLPLAMVPAAALLLTLFDAGAKLRLPAPLRATVGLALLAAVGRELWRPSARSLEGIEQTKAIGTVKRMKRNSAQWAALGRAVREKLPADFAIATTAAGALPYFAGHRTIDESGLCDRHTAKVDADPWLLDRPGHMKQATRAWLAQLRPQVIFWHPRIEPATTPPEQFPIPPTPDYELRAMGVPELAEEGDCAFFWVRKDVMNGLVPLGIVPARESARLAKAPPPASERTGGRPTPPRDRRAEEIAAELAALLADPPPPPPTLDPPLPPPRDGPVYATERLHAAPADAEEMRFSVADVTRPLWLPDGPAELAITGEAGSWLELDLANAPTENPARTEFVRRAGSVAPKSVAVSLAAGGSRRELPARVLDAGAAPAWRTVRAELGGMPPGRYSLEVAVDGKPVGRGSSWLATVPRVHQLADRDDRPNVLLITIDTLRADYLGCYRHDRPTSPRIDGLAREGVLFERNLSQASWTLPSYASVFSGLYLEGHGVVHRDHRFAGSFVTFIEKLAQAGYATGAVVSGTFTDAFWHFDQGFDSYDDLGMVIDESRPRREDGSADPMTPDAMKAKAHRRITAPEVANKAIAWLDAHRDRRFALLVHFFDPHEDYLRHPGVSERFPVRPPPRDFPNAVDPKPEVTATRRALYEGEIAYTDLHVGRVLDRLDRLGLAANTVVVLFSDHGESFREHLIETDPARDFRNLGHGSSLFNEQVHTPLIVRAPGIAPGRVVASTGNLDLGPTVLELCGVDADDWPSHGRSLVELLRDPEGERGEHVFASQYAAMPRPGAPAGERRHVGHRIDLRGLAAIEYETGGGRQRFLFDWRERWQDYARNLASSMEETLDKLTAYYRQRRPAMDALLRPPDQVKIGADTTQVLRGLGYLSDRDE